MPDDDWALGQNLVDVRNEARREYQRGHLPTHGPLCSCQLHFTQNPEAQIALCTNDERCQAAADEHNPDCPIEQSLQDEFGGF